MSEANGKSTVRRSVPAPATADLSVVVACHTFVCAISTRNVLRLALEGDVEQTGDDRTGRVVRSGGEWFTSFNLGPLLGIPPLASAWVLLRVPRLGRDIPIALHTGPCLVVRQVRVEAPLPRKLFSSRGAAVLGAFVAGSRMGLDDSLSYGLVLDVERLWTDAELDSAESSIARVRGRVPHA